MSVIAIIILLKFVNIFINLIFFWSSINLNLLIYINFCIIKKSNFFVYLDVLL